MKINYGINRRMQGKKGIEHPNHVLIMPDYAIWEASDTQAQIKKMIIEKHPGWNITGYALAEEDGNDRELN